MSELCRKAEQVYGRLFDLCSKADFEGHDPFDGLSSKCFRSMPLIGRVAAARLVWLQIIKRSPFDLRGLLAVPTAVNPKGLGLFLSSEIKMHRVLEGTVHLNNARKLAKAIEEMSFETESGRAWGYPFDWQSRAFFAPRNTPTIVPTVFAANGLLDLFETSKDEKILKLVSEVCDFIVGDLNRPVEDENHLCFSYTPIDSSIILNASLLAAELLARFDSLRDSHENRPLVRKCVAFVNQAQLPNGAWSYGTKLRHKWVDNFHTAFILISLKRIERFSGIETSEEIDSGIRYWLENFFTPKGEPKYYDTTKHPIDIHSAAAAIHGLSELGSVYPEARKQASSVLRWTLDNMLLDNGHFRYQKTSRRDINHQFMRWNDAWMAYALSSFIEMEKSQ